MDGNVVATLENNLKEISDFLDANDSDAAVSQKILCQHFHLDHLSEESDDKLANVHLELSNVTELLYSILLEGIAKDDVIFSIRFLLREIVSLSRESREALLNMIEITTVEEKNKESSKLRRVSGEKEKAKNSDIFLDEESTAQKVKDISFDKVEAVKQTANYATQQAKETANDTVHRIKDHTYGSTQEAKEKKADKQGSKAGLAPQWRCPRCSFLNVDIKHRCVECSRRQPQPMYTNDSAKTNDEFLGLQKGWNEEGDAIDTAREFQAARRKLNTYKLHDDQRDRYGGYASNNDENDHLARLEERANALSEWERNLELWEFALSEQSVMLCEKEEKLKGLECEMIMHLADACMSGDTSKTTTHGLSNETLVLCDAHTQGESCTVKTKGEHEIRLVPLTAEIRERQKEMWSRIHSMLRPSVENVDHSVFYANNWRDVENDWCTLCREYGHLKRYCAHVDCYICGDLGHISIDCPCAYDDGYAHDDGKYEYHDYDDDYDDDAYGYVAYEDDDVIDYQDHGDDDDEDEDWHEANYAYGKDIFYGYCYSCDKYGHKAIDCHYDEHEDYGRRQRNWYVDYQCYYCGKYGHIQRFCWQKEEDEVWYARKKRHTTGYMYVTHANLNMQKDTKSCVKEKDEKCDAKNVHFADDLCKTGDRLSYGMLF